MSDFWKPRRIIAPEGKFLVAQPESHTYTPTQSVAHTLQLTAELSGGLGVFFPSKLAGK